MTDPVLYYLDKFDDEWLGAVCKKACETLTPLYKAVSLVMSQRIPFKLSRVFRERIKDKSDTQLRDPNLYTKHPNREVICKVIQLKEVDEKTLSTIKGIGPWTINAFLIWSRKDNNIFLYNDKWIQKNIIAIYGINMNKMQIDVLWDGKLAIVSRFLWRLNETGVNRINRGMVLDRTCFV